MGTRKKCTCRGILWLLVFFGFAVNYMLRVNLNLTIVAMVIPRPQAAAVALCYAKNDTVSWTNETLEDNNVTFSFPSTTPSSENVTYENRFPWNEYEQGMALGAYFWLQWLSQLPGGLLAKRYGTKIVFGLGNLLTALLGFLIPFATDLNILITIRVMQGFLSGVVWPSMHNMAAKWIPPNERSRFVSAYFGSSVGAAITYPLCAAIINSLDWGASFHVTSLIAVIWYCFWYFLVYDTPQQHPRITDDERNYIVEQIGNSIDNKETRIPWKSILTSGPVWVTIFALWGAGWGLLTLMTQAPTYFKFIHGWNINAVGILAGAPHIFRMIFSYVFSYLSDWLLRTKRMSRTNVRKLGNFVCTGVQGIFILILGYSGCYPILATVFLMAGLTVNGAMSTSALAAVVELSPNYASVILGFCGMIVTWSGFISPAIVAVLTNNNQTVERWRLVFIISAVNSFGSCVIYTIFGTAKEQPWNNYSQMKERELQKFTSKRDYIEDVDDTEKSKFIEKQVLQHDPPRKEV